MGLLSKVEKDHPEIELKYLPPYQRKQVEATIAEGNLADAREKVTELATQATACKKDAQRRAAEKNAPSDAGQADGTDTDATKTSSTSGTTTKTKQTSATPTPGPSLSEEEKKLVPQCGKQ